MRICIDAGHGGSDPGASGNGLVEKLYALAYALELGACLQKIGCEVYYTRTTDVFVDLSPRAAYANGIPVDYFISVHFNYFDGSGSAHGVEVFAYSTGGASYQLAQAVVNEICAATGMYNRGPKTANYAVLRETNMSAILIEGGFLDNASDAAQIAGDTYKRNYMIGATKGICQVLGIPWTNPYQEVNKVTNAVLAYGPDDAVTARRLAESMDNCAIFYRKADGSAPADVSAASTLYIVGGGSVGHPKEVILSGSNYFRTTDLVGKSIGQ